jgi:hypothetical protein
MRGEEKRRECGLLSFRDTHRERDYVTELKQQYIKPTGVTLQNMGGIQRTPRKDQVNLQTLRIQRVEDSEIGEDEG